MVTTLYSGAALIAAIYGAGWNAHDVILLKPEAQAIHKRQWEVIQVTGAKVDEIQRIQIEQMKIDRGIKVRDLHRTRDPVVRQNIQQDIQDLDKKIKNAEEIRKIK